MTLSGKQICAQSSGFLPTQTNELDRGRFFWDFPIINNHFWILMLRSFLSLRAAGAALVLSAALIMPAVASARPQTCSSPLTRDIPDRTARAPSGSKVMAQLMQTGGTERDAAVVRQVLSGNMPAYLRKLVPVYIAGTLAGGQAVLVTICVTPGYLSVGSDSDFVRVPMGLAAAAQIADQLGFLLPTTKMVDAIYAQAQVQLSPKPMKPTNQMSSTAYLVKHDQTVDQQRARQGRPMSVLTAGQKKDLVLTNRLISKPGRVAIYGWQRPGGKPIQPLSTVHGATYADYSHGVRLVSRTAYVNGEPRELSEIMRDSDLSRIVSSEGPINNARALLASLY